MPRSTHCSGYNTPGCVPDVDPVDGTFDECRYSLIETLEHFADCLLTISAKRLERSKYMRTMWSTGFTNTNGNLLGEIKMSLWKKATGAPVTSDSEVRVYDESGREGYVAIRRSVGIRYYGPVFQFVRKFDSNGCCVSETTVVIDDSPDFA